MNVESVTPFTAHRMIIYGGKILGDCEYIRVKANEWMENDLYGTREDGSEHWERVYYYEDIEQAYQTWLKEQK